MIMQRDKDRAENIVEMLSYPERIYPIGRLDKESEGLILMTNQGDLVNKIMRSTNAHEKEYIVTVDKVLTDEFIKRRVRIMNIQLGGLKTGEYRKVTGEEYKRLIKLLEGSTSLSEADRRGRQGD